MSRGRGYILLFAMTTAGLVLLFALAPSWLHVESVSGSTQTFGDRLQIQLHAIETWTGSRLPMFESVNLAERVTEHATNLAQRFFLEEFPSLVTGFAINLILVPFIAYFMVRDGRRLKRRVVGLVPNRYFEMSLIMLHRIDEQIGGYLRGRLIECMLVGLTQMLMMGMASAFIQQPQILLISVVCGVTNLIPYAGPVLGAAFGVGLYFATDVPLASIWMLLGIIAVAHLLDNVLIAPAVLSHNVDLHPLTVALVLVIGGEVLGILGLLIAVPVAASMKVVIQEFYANYQAQAR
jgi:predicted PurR-regulated permease PerM